MVDKEEASKWDAAEEEPIFPLGDICRLVYVRVQCLAKKKREGEQPEKEENVSANANHLSNLGSVGCGRKLHTPQCRVCSMDASWRRKKFPRDLLASSQLSYIKLWAQRRTNVLSLLLLSRKARMGKEGRRKTENVQRDK